MSDDTSGRNEDVPSTAREGDERGAVTVDMPNAGDDTREEDRRKEVGTI